MVLPHLLALSLLAARGEPPVLAYLFTLRRARHPLPHAWATYFSGCPAGSYKIHIHVDPTFNATDAAETGPAAKYFKQENVLPRELLTKVRRFGHELVQARMRLLRHATKPDADGTPAPLWYSFFSESCAPISTCAKAHAYLSAPEQANQSFIDNTRPMPPQQARAQRHHTHTAPHSHRDAGTRPCRRTALTCRARTRALAVHQIANDAEWQREFASTCPRCAAAGLTAADFRYSPGWVTLWRKHAKELVAKEHLYDDMISHWGWSKARAPPPTPHARPRERPRERLHRLMTRTPPTRATPTRARRLLTFGCRGAVAVAQLVNGIPDESYWSMLAQHLGHRITGKLTTYMEPGDAKTGHSKMFFEGDVERLWQQPAPSFFARKFKTTPKEDKALDKQIAAARKLEPPAADADAAAAPPSAGAKGPGGKAKGKGGGGKAKGGGGAVRRTMA